MNLFLTCFLACLFAFVVVVVLSIQVIGFLFRRWFFKNLPEILSQAMHTMHTRVGAGHPADEAAIRELLDNAAVTPPGVTPHLSVVTCACGIVQDVPFAAPLPPFLLSVGWHFEPRLEGWICSACVKRLAG